MKKKFIPFATVLLNAALAMSLQAKPCDVSFGGTQQYFGFSPNVSAVNPQPLHLSVATRDLSVVTLASEQAAPTTQVIGYCSDNLQSAVAPIGIEGISEARVSAAIHLTRDVMVKYEGMTITKLRFAVRPGMKNFSVWVRSRLTESSKVVQSVKEVADGWNEVELKSPVKIDGNDLYLGYTATQFGNTKCVLSEGEGNEYTSWIAMNNSWQDAHKDGVGKLYIQAIAEGKMLNREAAMASLTTDKTYYSSEETMSLKGRIVNFHKGEAKKYTVDCYVSGKLVKSQEFDQQNAGDVSEFVVQLPLSDYAAGVYAVTTKIRDTQQESEGMTVNLNVYDKNSSYPRMLLLEQFTSLQCVNCPPQDRKLEKVVEHRNDVVWVAHRVGYKYDEFTIDESKPMVNFGVGGNPFIMVNRAELEENTPPAFIISNYSVTDVGDIFDAVKNSSPTFVGLKVAAQPNGSGKLNVTVDGEAIPFFQELYPRAALHIYVVEDSVRAVAAQSGDANKKFHNNVLRAFVTGTRGVLPKWEATSSADATQQTSKLHMTYQTEVDVKEAWNLDHLRIAAFMVAQTPVMKSYPTGEVLNATQSRLQSVSGIGTLSSQQSVSARGNQWYTLDGRKVSAPTQKGIYITNGKKVIIK